MMTVQALKSLLNMSNPDAIVILAKDKVGSEFFPSGLLINGNKFDTNTKSISKHGTSCVILYPE